jgi:hypothetical protein
MDKRLEHISVTLPKAALGKQDFYDLVDQHVSNARSLRAEAFRHQLIALGNVIRFLGRQTQRRLATAGSWFGNGSKTCGYREPEIGTHG